MDIYTYIKKILLSIIIIAPSFCNAQQEELKILNKSDTIYIVINKKDKITRASNNLINKDNFNYILWFELETLPEQSIFLSNHYSFASNKKVCKSFLEENKENIVEFKFLNTLGYEASYKKKKKKKQLYIIDKEETGWFKIKLREVKIADKKTLISVE